MGVIEQLDADTQRHLPILQSAGQRVFGRWTKLLADGGPDKMSKVSDSPAFLTTEHRQECRCGRDESLRHIVRQQSEIPAEMAVGVTRTRVTNLIESGMSA